MLRGIDGETGDRSQAITARAQAEGGHLDVSWRLSLEFPGSAKAVLRPLPRLSGPWWGCKQLLVEKTS